MQPRPSTLKGKALQLLAARDHSRAELQAKLLHWLRAQTAKENEANRHPAVDESDDSPDFNAITEAAAQ
ncbi:MAG: hypothetical protein Q4G39_00755, partial [Brachymonas sp.]|nr:hypothetical protein [Brachymonas sp.]